MILRNPYSLETYEKKRKNKNSSTAKCVVVSNDIDNYYIQYLLVEQYILKEEHSRWFYPRFYPSHFSRFVREIKHLA